MSDDRIRDIVWKSLVTTRGLDDVVLTDLSLAATNVAEALRREGVGYVGLGGPSQLFAFEVPLTCQDASEDW